MKERVQKLMAQANVGSRRACEELIEQGRVRVNGAVIKLGDKADPETDVIEVDGERLKFDVQRKIYIALNKPRNVLSTSATHKGEERPTVYDLVPVADHLFMVGRLDADSEGLVVLTNDGDLANRLTHPRYRHTKTYKVTVYGMPTTDALERWANGVNLGEDGVTSPCVVKIVKGDKGFTELRVIMTEGKKRQIRRVASELGYPVRRLVRTHIGKLGVGELRPGEWRELNADEVKLLQTPDPAFREARAAARQERSGPMARRRKPQAAGRRRPVSSRTPVKGGKKRPR